MKFHLTLSFLLFFVISVFAQPQKGDYFLGSSNISFNHFGEDNNLFVIAPTFGAFVANNTLVGGSVALLGNSSDTQTQVAIFVNQFFGKGKLKGLTSFQLTNVDKVTFSDIQIGAAFFPVDNASINLVYRVLPFAARNGDFEMFPNQFRPDIGLSMRFFLLRNREEVEPILARNSIKAGTKKIGLSGNFERRSSTNSLILNETNKFFVKDRFFLEANFGAALYAYPLSDRRMQYAFVPQFGGGYYVNIAKDFALKFGARLSLGMTNENQLNTSDLLKTRLKSGLINAGFAIFKGRHKVEPTVGVDLFTVSVKDTDAESVSAANVQIEVEYEYFLSKNTSLTGLFTALPKNKTFRASRFAGQGDTTYGFYDFERNSFNFVLGFNYYIMR